MADVFRGRFGARGARDTYRAQDTGEPPDSPDIERPPDHLPRPGPDNERIETPDDITGEDVEERDPPKRDPPLPM